MGKGPDRRASPVAFREEERQRGLKEFFVSNLNRRHQNNAADGQRSYDIEKRFHGFSPVNKNADQTSLFLSN
ncbi:hypothetical protein [Parasphingorhabdus sp.]